MQNIGQPTPEGNPMRNTYNSPDKKVGGYHYPPVAEIAEIADKLANVNRLLEPKGLQLRLSTKQIRQPAVSREFDAMEGSESPW